MKLTKYVQGWLARAEDDIKTMEILLKEDGPARIICFHSQQAAEKYLKGFLAHYGKHIRKVHDLSSLLLDCLKLDGNLKNLEKSVDYVSQFYLGARYPADAPEFSVREARRAYEVAISIREGILKRIKK